MNAGWTIRENHKTPFTTPGPLSPGLEIFFRAFQGVTPYDLTGVLYWDFFFSWTIEKKKSQRRSLHDSKRTAFSTPTFGIMGSPCCHRRHCGRGYLLLFHFRRTKYKNKLRHQRSPRPSPSFRWLHPEYQNPFGTPWGIHQFNGSFRRKIKSVIQRRFGNGE